MIAVILSCRRLRGGLEPYLTGITGKLAINGITESVANNGLSPRSVDFHFIFDGARLFLAVAKSAIKIIVQIMQYLNTFAGFFQCHNLLGSKFINAFRDYSCNSSRDILRVEITVHDIDEYSVLTSFYIRIIPGVSFPSMQNMPIFGNQETLAPNGFSNAVLGMVAMYRECVVPKLGEHLPIVVFHWNKPEFSLYMLAVSKKPV